MAPHLDVRSTRAQRFHQLAQSVRNIQQDARAPRRNSGGVAHELDRVAITLFVVKQN
jgi:hypothetical protein